MTAQVAAVFSAYAPTARLELAARAAREAGADRVVVVDDGTPSELLASHEVLDRISGWAEVLRQGGNTGIAAALNRGITAVMEEADDVLVLTMDQDTILGAGDVAALRRILEDAEAAGLAVAGAAPAFMGPARFAVAGTDRGFTLLRDPIQSGLLVRAATYRRVGLLWEDLFIDAVDTEFALRCGREHLVFVAAPELHLEHSLGEARPVTVLGRHVRILGRRRSFARHAPVRTYYMARNAAALRRTYGGTDALRAKMTTDALSFALSVVYGPSRLRQLRAIAAGFRDGARGRLGAIPARRRAQLSPRPRS